MYAYLCMYSFVWGRVHSMWVQVHVEGRCLHWVFPLIALHLIFWDRIFHWSRISQIQLDLLISKLQGSAVSLPLQHWDYRQEPLVSVLLLMLFNIDQKDRTLVLMCVANPLLPKLLLYAFIIIFSVVAQSLITFNFLTVSSSSHSGEKSVQCWDKDLPLRSWILIFNNDSGSQDSCQHSWLVLHWLDVCIPSPPIWLFLFL